MKKIISIMCAAAMLAGAAGPLPVRADAGFEKRTYPFYLGDMDTYLEEDVALYFEDGADDLPYMEISDYAKLYPVIMNELMGDHDFSLTVDAEDDFVRVSRENGFYMDLEYNSDTISFNDYDAFIHNSRDSSLLDKLSETGFNEAGEAELFYRNANATYNRSGDYITLNLADYDIDLVRADDLYFVPLQTISDFLISPPTGMSFLFNGKALLLAKADQLITGQSGLTPLGQYYYSAETAERSKKLAEYSYHELCLMLDNLYGLKGAHNVDDFDKLFWEMDFKDDLMSTDPRAADQALIDFIDFTLDDLHSLFRLPSWMTGTSIQDNGIGFAYASLVNHSVDFKKARREAYPDGLYMYEEVGNTAFVTFDKFVSNYAYSYYLQQEEAESGASPVQAEGTEEAGLKVSPEAAGEQTESDGYIDSIEVDTIGLIIDAHKRITREGSPIENVVIDLSNNTGGDVDAAIVALSWFLGDAPLAVYSTFTGALSNSMYRADINLDRKFDDTDTVKNYNLYCLISPVSFSCGNLLPSVFKNSQNVTLIGKTSGGGSCIVQNISTAYGTLFQISGPGRLSFTKNGSFYDIDQGMEPDVYLDNIHHYYDREWMADYINNMP